MANAEIRGVEKERYGLGALFSGISGKIGQVVAGCAIATTLTVGATGAADAAIWQSTNVQLLYGWDYTDTAPASMGGFPIDSEDKVIMTLEHADGWKYGDNFFFVDVNDPWQASGGGDRFYGEFSPRISPSTILTGAPISFGPVKDVMVASTFEMGENTHAWLIGVGLPLDLPGFAFADINVYARRSYSDFANAWSTVGGQVTIDWLYPFQIGGTKWQFTGFFDYAFGENGGSNYKTNNIITEPQLLLDLGDLLFDTPDQLHAGIEYSIWRNKFGIDGADQDTVQAMVKWTF